MSLFIYPPAASSLPANAATETTQLAVKADLDTVVTNVSSLAKGFFTLTFDEISIDKTGLTTDVYTSKLATVSRQVLTITYSDSTKSNMTNVKVV